MQGISATLTNTELKMLCNNLTTGTTHFYGVLTASPEWEGYTILAIFEQNGVTASEPVENGVFEVPTQSLESGIFRLGFIGTKDGEVLKSKQMRGNITQSSDPSDAVPPEDLWSQYLTTMEEYVAKVKESEEIVTSVGNGIATAVTEGEQQLEEHATKEKDAITEHAQEVSSTITESAASAKESEENAKAYAEAAEEAALSGNNKGFRYLHTGNMFNQSELDVEKDTLLDASGNTELASDWDTTDFIAVDSFWNTQISINKPRYICQYNKYKEHIDIRINNEGSSMCTFTLHPDTTYIRFSYHDSVYSTLHMQYGVMDSNYRAVYTPPILKYENGDPVTVDNVLNNKYTFELVGKNLYDPNASNKNTALSVAGATMGNVITSEDYNTSDFIKVNSDATMSVRNARSIAFFNKDYCLLSLIDNTKNEDKTFTTSEVTAYIKIVASKDKENLTQLEYGESCTVYEEPVYGLFIDGKKIYELKGSEEPMAATGSSFKISSEKNLFKNEKLSTDCVLNSAGSTNPAVGWATTNYIEVMQEKEMSVNNARSICQYNSKKNLISYYDNTAPCPPHTFTTEPGTCYVRYSIWGTTANVTQLEYGNECTEYAEYKPVMTLDGYKVSDLPFGNSTTTTAPSASTSSFDVKPGKNMCNPEEVTTNLLLKSDGDTQTSSGWCTTDFIEVEGGKQVSVNGPRFYCEYDANKNKIKFTDNTGDCPNTTFTTAENTAYIRVSSYNSNKIQVEYGSACTAYEIYALSMTLNGKKIIDVADLANIGAGVSGGSSAFVATSEKNLFNLATVERNKVLNTSGVAVTAGGWNTSALISVEPEKTYSINDSRYVAQYDASEVLIDFHDNTVNCSEYTFTVLENAAYVRYSMYYADQSQMELGSECTSYANYKGIMTLNGVKVMDLPMITAGGAGSAGLINMSEYEQVVSRDKFEIYKAMNYYNKVVAILRNYAVMIDGYAIGSTISISETGIQGDYHNQVVFNATNFPDLIAGSEIKHVLLMPYTRNAGSGREGYQTRCAVITSLGQIYHNYPTRSATTDGNTSDGDIVRFDQSVIWDLPGRSFPVATTVEATDYYSYLPGLPDVCYQMHPPVNEDNGYGHGGFGSTATNNGETVSRFYQPGRTAQTNSFTFMGGYEPDDKVTVIGTYLSNTTEGCRICVFATDDGGRSWYNKFELGDDHRSALGNTFDTTGLEQTYAESFAQLEDGLFVHGRTTHYPSAEDKEPETLFEWTGGIGVANVSNAEKCVVTTTEVHGLKNGQVIAFTLDTATNVDAGEYEWMLNCYESADLGVQPNKRLFKAKVLSSTSFELHEHVMNPNTNLTCRHIHHINRVKDGWIIGTGEMYPDGWIFFMQMKASDAFVTHLANQPFDVIRLNSTEESIQRLLGATMYDDQDTTMVFAVDNELTPRRNVTMPPGRTESFSRGSTGVFKGRLQDIDDMDLFDCIYEAKQVAYFFKEIKGIYIYCGQQGEFAISFDQGANWVVEDLERRAQTYFGESGKVVVIDEFIIAIR